MSTVLLTGANGFIGRHTIRHLVGAGFTVHAVARAAFDAPAGVSVHVADLLDRRQQEALIETVRPSHLMHLAWYVEHGKFWRSLENLRWVDASLQLLTAFAKAGGRRWLCAGTCAEYDWTREGPLDESSTLLRPATVYGAAKHALETMISAVARELAVSTAWCRLFHLYGPDESPERLVPSLTRAMIEGRPAVCRSGGLTRDFLHVDDLGRALACVLMSQHEEPVNVCSGEPVRIAEVAECIAEATGRPDLLRLEAGGVQQGEPERLVGSSRVLMSLGFRPAYTLPLGIAATVAWWRERLRRA